MLNSVSLINSSVNSKKLSVQQTEVLPYSKNLKHNNIDTFTKNKNINQGPTCGIDCCAI